MNYCLCVVILLASCFIVQGERRGPPDVVIATGKGAITAVQSGSQWILRQMPYTGGIMQQWRVDQHPTYNGYIISSSANGNLVWDTQGYKFVSGTPIGLHQLKSGLVETKNQRWYFEDNKFAIIYNWSMVANVTQSGNVVLAKRSGSHQQFELIPAYYQEMFDFYNLHTGPVSVTITSPVGNSNYVVNTQQKLVFAYFPDSTMVIKDLNGTELPPSPYMLSGPSARVPPLTLPVGLRTWSGFVASDKNYATTFSATLSSYSISGSGSNELGGSFTLTGSYADGGNFMITITYAGFSATHHGNFDVTGTTMYGNWTRNFQRQGSFEFTLQ